MEINAITNKIWIIYMNTSNIKKPLDINPNKYATGFKLLILIIFTICFILLFVKNPYKIIDNYNSLIIIISLATMFYTFYINIKSNPQEKDDYGNIPFDIFKYSIILICYIFIIGFYYGYSSSGYLTTNFFLPILMLLLAGGIFIISYLMLYIYANVKIKNTSIGNIEKNKNIILTILKYFLFFSFGLMVSIITIQWIIELFSHASSSSSIIKLLINILIIIVLCSIIFKMITYGDFYKGNAIVQLIINTIFYIPCLFVAFIDNIIKIFGLTSNNNEKGLFQPTKTDYILLIISILLYVIYYFYPIVYNTYDKQGGKLLLNEPVYLNNETTISTYMVMNNDAKDYKYSYAISFWVYINSDNPNIQTIYTNILNYGNKPAIKYKGDDNSILYTMDNEGLAGDINPIKNKDFEYDESGNIIIFKQTGIKLQKWNNIIINVNGGTFDIFYNGELIKSKPGVIPVMSFDTLTVGGSNGINGGICSIVYFPNEINSSQIHTLYHSLKNKTPPISNKMSFTF